MTRRRRRSGKRIVPIDLCEPSRRLSATAFFVPASASGHVRARARRCLTPGRGWTDSRYPASKMILGGFSKIINVPNSQRIIRQIAEAYCQLKQLSSVTESILREHEQPPKRQVRNPRDRSETLDHPR